jgi:hypothetical protein
MLFSTRIWLLFLPELVPSRQLSRVFGQRALHRFRFSVNDHQECPGSATRYATPLFPILHSPHADAKVFRKFRLAHSHLPPNAPYVDLLWNMRLAGVLRFPFGKRECLARTPDDSLACCAHSYISFLDMYQPVGSKPFSKWIAPRQKDRSSHSSRKC